jgi:hypothetical protein
VVTRAPRPAPTDTRRILRAVRTMFTTYAILIVLGIAVFTVIGFAER